MKCARAIDLFSSYAENAMEPPLRVAFEQHLAECGECKAAYRKFNATLMMLEEMPEVEVPAGFHTAMMARIEQNRQTNPHPVRWWHLDWQTVFTVRVPARALALGLAVLLLMALLVRLTPVTSIMAGFFPSRHVVVQPDPNLPKLPSGAPNGSCVISQPGLTICVDTSALGTSTDSYTLVLSVKGDSATGYEIYLMPEAATSPDVQAKPYLGGFVHAKQPDTVRVGAGENTVARVEWQQGGRSYREYVFLPSHFSSEAADRMIVIENTSVYGALRQISETYGVVILASGDLNKTVLHAGGRSLNTQDAIFGVVTATGLKWSGRSPGVYVVEPGS